MDIGVQAVFRYHVHTRIAECRYRVKQGDPHAFDAKFRHKYRHVQEGADTLHQKRAGDHFTDELYHAGQGIQIEGVLNQHPVLDADSAVKADHQPGHNCDNAESADLYQKEDDDLPEKAPCGKGRNGHKPCHADGGGCSKERIYIGYGYAVRRADGQGKQRASRQNCQQKAEQDCLRCG